MKKVLTFLIILLGAFFLSVSYSHALTEVDSYASLVDGLSSGGDLILTSDVNVTSNINATSDASLNLNGHKIKLNGNTLIIKSNMTIFDGTDNKEGSIEGSVNFPIEVGTSGVNGNLVINSGTINCKGKYGIRIRTKGSLTMNDGTVVGKSYIIYNENTFELNGGLVHAKNGMVVQNKQNSLFTMNGGVVITDADYQAVNLYGDCKAIINNGEIHAHKDGTDYQGNGISLFKNTELIVNGGLISSYGNAIMGNGSISGDSEGSNAKITITGGTIEASDGAALYNPQYNGETLITGGTFTGISAVEVRAGKVTITGGTFNGTSQYKVTDYANGTSTDGAAISIAQHDTKKPIDVTITGGNFNAEVPVSYTNPLNNEQEYIDLISINILGGNYRTIGDTCVISLDNKDIIAGGTYNTNPSQLVKNGYGVKVNSGIYSVLRKYNVSIDDTSKDDITLSASSSFKDDIVTVTPKEKWGYISNVIISYGNTSKEITDNKFIMPDDDVLVKVTYDNRYKILSGDNQTYKDKDIVIKTNGSLDNLDSIKINGKVVDKSNIILENGSTILTIKSSYLNKLSSGNYNVSFLYTDGEVSTNLTINDKLINPKTGDDILKYFIILGISLVGIGVTSICLYKINKKSTK